MPDLLARGEVDAIVTDRFEKKHFKRSDWPESCEPPATRKVFWVAPARARDLGPRLDAWLARNESQVDAARVRWLGESARRSDTDHLLDLIARRLALMPAVARAKARAVSRSRIPRARTRVVAASGRARAPRDSTPRPSRRCSGCRSSSAGGCSRPTQTRATPRRIWISSETLRPAIGALGDRIVSALAEQAPIPPASLDGADWAPLAVWLSEPERVALRDALLAVRKTSR